MLHEALAVEASKNNVNRVKEIKHKQKVQNLDHMCLLQSSVTQYARAVGKH
jgi:hypothetical protein